MYSWLQLARKYLHYYLTSSNGKGHGIHSPFMYDFVSNVINDDRYFYHYESIEFLRDQLLKDETLLEIEDFGAGSVTGKPVYRSISSVAARAAKGKRLSQLLFRIVNYYHPVTILELGTSLGISGAYMAAASANSKLITIEGSSSIANRAKRNFEQLGLDNIKLINGNFEDWLPEILRQINQVDLAFVDGNHRLEPTTRYFDQLLSKSTQRSIFIFDDIHWSEEMEQAWRIIQNHPSVTASIDLFYFGIVLFRSEFKSNQRFTIRF